MRHCVPNPLTISIVGSSESPLLQLILYLVAHLVVFLEDRDQPRPSGAYVTGLGQAGHVRHEAKPV
jgi:hypothetical protein